MSKFEWSTLFLNDVKSKEMLMCSKYAINFFNSKFLFMIEEHNDIKSFNKLRIISSYLKKDIMDNYLLGVAYSFDYDNRKHLYTCRDETGGIFWRKL